MALAKSEDADYLPGWCAPHYKAPSPGKSGKKVRSPDKVAHED